MIKLQVFAFLLRWLASSIGMYFCLTYLAVVTPEATTSGPVASVISVIGPHSWALFAVAGLIFSVINSILKPIIKVLALPLAILTLGISTVIINTIMVILTINLLPGVEMSFWPAVLSSIILSAINAVLNFLIK